MDEQNYPQAGDMPQNVTPPQEPAQQTQIFTQPAAPGGLEALPEEERFAAAQALNDGATQIYPAAEAPGAGKKAPPKPPKPPKTQEQLDYEAAKKQRFRQYVWGPILHPIVALLVICLATSLLLGLTNQATAPLIEANAKAEADAAMRRLLPEADNFAEVPPAEGVENVDMLYQAANGAGWVIQAWGRGYGGKVPALVAFDEGGSIAGVTFLENSETPGLGQNLVTDAGFAAQFAGLPGQAVPMDSIDKIASATISTGAAVNAVNAAVNAYGVQVLGQSAAAATPEEVRAQLLPGEELIPISIAGDNVQPIAYASDNGNYIIYGEKPSDREDSDSVTVAAVAVDGAGTILNVWIDTSGDSPQYGATLMTNRPFLESFVGESAPVQVDTVADITGSSTSVIQAVNSALAALPAAQAAKEAA